METQNQKPYLDNETDNKVKTETVFQASIMRQITSENAIELILY